MKAQLPDWPVPKSVKMIKLPITDNFDIDVAPVGLVSIREDALPALPEWVLSLSYKVLERGTGGTVSEYEPVAMALTTETIATVDGNGCKADKSKSDIDRRGFTPLEAQCMKGLMDAYSAFLEMERQHPDEMRDFVDPVHRIQDLLALRVVRRDHPEGWPTHVVSDPTKGKP